MTHVPLDFRAAAALDAQSYQDVQMTKGKEVDIVPMSPPRKMKGVILVLITKPS